MTKPADPPEPLALRGAARRAEHEAEFLEHREAFESGDRVFAFDRSIYADASVRDVLVRAQHGKCCFCESKLSHVIDGDVEHFRPKAAVRQARNHPLERPGYYWLAYEWKNLYLACPMCNQRNKQNLFPLVDPAARARSHEHADQVTVEQPAFIDPGVDDPEQLIGFRDGEPYPIDGNARASATITALELGRTHLIERRSERVRLLEFFLDSLAATDRAKYAELVEEAATLIAEYTRDDAEFTSVTRCLVRERLGDDTPMPLNATDLVDYARAQLRGRTQSC